MLIGFAHGDECFEIKECEVRLSCGLTLFQPDRVMVGWVMPFSPGFDNGINPVREMIVHVRGGSGFRREPRGKSHHRLAQRAV
jgi:hypothetical protein